MLMNKYSSMKDEEFLDELEERYLEWDSPILEEAARRIERLMGIFKKKDSEGGIQSVIECPACECNFNPEEVD
jgi:hypothetical protein